MKLEDIINQGLVVQLEALKADQALLKQIQTRLSELSLYPGGNWIDGLYGDRTEKSLIDFCEAVHLSNMETGQFGKTFAEKLLNAQISDLPNTARILDIEDFKRAADFLGAELAAIRAVVEVESSGRGFFADGRPKILFERHIFYRETNGRFAQSHRDICNSNPGGYIGGNREYTRLEKAQSLDHTAALKSASWGLGQVMGFNHRVVGYNDVESFVAAMYSGEPAQLDAMMKFIVNAHPKLALAIRQRDWATFARHYNGRSGVGVYDVKIASAYDRWSSVAAIA